MTDIELLPLPSVLLNWPHPTNHAAIRDYARANVTHHTAAQDAEIEALRAEVAAWRELSDHVRAGACNAIWPDRYTDARTRDVAAALKRAERLADALRDAEKSLRTIADLAGGTEYLMTVGDVRGYANSRAYAARAALRDHDKGESNAP